MVRRICSMLIFLFRSNSYQNLSFLFSFLLFSDLGKYGSSPGVCTDCLPGLYQDGKGSTQCKTPPDGMSANAARTSFSKPVSFHSFFL